MCARERCAWRSRLNMLCCAARRGRGGLQMPHTRDNMGEGEDARGRRGRRAARPKRRDDETAGRLEKTSRHGRRRGRRRSKQKEEEARSICWDRGRGRRGKRSCPPVRGIRGAVQRRRGPWRAPDSGGPGSTPGHWACGGGRYVPHQPFRTTARCMYHYSTNAITTASTGVNIQDGQRVHFLHTDNSKRRRMPLWEGLSLSGEDAAEVHGYLQVSRRAVEGIWVPRYRAMCLEHQRGN